MPRFPLESAPTGGNQTSPIFQDRHQQPEQRNQLQLAAPLSSPDDPSRTQLAIPSFLMELFCSKSLQLMWHLQNNPEAWHPTVCSSPAEFPGGTAPSKSWPISRITGNDGHDDELSIFHTPPGPAPTGKAPEPMGAVPANGQDSQFPPQICARGMRQHKGGRFSQG